MPETDIIVPIKITRPKENEERNKNVIIVELNGEQTKENI